MGQYRTIQGDMWDAFAYKVYGNEKLFPILMVANPQYITVVIFDAGAQLVVPDPPEETVDDLPPWKRDDVD
ncbi:membrane protein [Paenibacillus sp. J23TS9]|uniref:tail protein X n=1 Tax=Paenibacillus sp. J23TS9 TaxID=2807193 RepID=UPI001B24B841|nr:tail protein X [Paenibacillus sp. J23TS9]GIP25473.1 membrane protein [Paenibacillus sp. J23TS9]